VSHHTRAGPTSLAFAPLFFAIGALLAAGCEPTSRSPRTQPDTRLGIYSPEQHGKSYDGHFTVTGAGIYQIGSVNDVAPWNHVGTDSANVFALSDDSEVRLEVQDGSVEDKKLDAKFAATIVLPGQQGTYRIELTRLHEFTSCRKGGISIYQFENGNSGCGDPAWPKSFVFVGVSGYGNVTRNGSLLWQDYEIHVSVTQGIYSREQHVANPEPVDGEVGAVNPATQQIDFWVASPDKNTVNTPPRAVFDHFFATKVTWE
jgi:hypothetical protein